MKIMKILKGWLIGFFRKKKPTFEPCQLHYIPDNLKTKGRTPIHSFYVGELLFMRCDAEDLNNPYNSITLAELSHNRRGKERHPMSNPSDVLYNIKSDVNFEKYPDKSICTIKILDLTETHIYDKSFQDSEKIATIKLIHDPLPCMYPHCVFRISYNGEIVTYDNYKQGLKKANKLRNQLKIELASMIVNNTLSQIA